MTGKRPRVGAARLDELIAEATVDCYSDEEQLTGLFTLIEDNLALPFQTNVLGVPVTVAGVDLTDREIVAICQRDDISQAIPLLELPLPVPAPGGAEWIEAYRRWARCAPFRQYGLLVRPARAVMWPALPRRSWERFSCRTVAPARRPTSE